VLKVESAGFSSNSLTAQGCARTRVLG